MKPRDDGEGDTVLICAPFGRDAETVAATLERQGFEARGCPDLDAVAAALDGGIGVVLLTEEAMASSFERLRAALSGQPAWSDVPFILLAARHTGARRSADSLRERLLDITGNAIVLERPLSHTSLVSAVSSALRARRRQFDMRDRIVELDLQHDRLNTLLENLPVGVAFVNPDCSTLISNPAFRRFRPDGAVPSDDPTISAQWQALDSHGQTLSAEAFPTRRALRGEVAPGVEYRYRPEGAPAVWTQVSATPLRDGAGRVNGAIAVIVDIDAQKRAQAALARAAAQLEEQVAARTAELEATLVRLRAETADRERAEASLRQSQKMEAVGQLTGGIAHDFNNMLTGVIGSLDIIRRRIATGRTDHLDRFLDAASESANRAAALTHRLLAFSRRQSLDAKPVDVNSLIQSMRDLVERAIDERVELAFALAPDLPNAMVDPHQLENALLNLVINARDAMPSGGVLTIGTSLADGAQARDAGLRVAGDSVVVAVTDTGVGMSAALIEKVFDPFFTTKPLGQGTGLGLSMVYGFVRQSGGEVRIESQPGMGASVRLYLPTTSAASPSVVAPELAATGGGGERVLVVEDDASVRLLVREVLLELRYQSVEFADPHAAIPALSSDDRIDLMITDVGLPGMNGRELAEIARRHRPALPILFITGYAENAAIRAGFLGSNMAMLGKPFSLDALAAKVSGMIAEQSGRSSRA